MAKNTSLLKQSVQRVLFYRLGLTTIVLAFFFSLIAYYHSSNMITDAVVQAASAQVHVARGRFKELIRENSADMTSILQDSINYPPDTNIHIKEGEFVYAMLHSKDRSNMGSYEHRNYPELPQVKQYLKETPTTVPKNNELEYNSIRIKGKPYLDIHSRLIEDGNGAPIFLRAIFAISDESIHLVHKQTLQIVLFVICITITTALFIYPLITHLINKLADSSTGLLTAHLETMEALGTAIAKRDSDTNSHNYRVTIYAVRLAEQLTTGTVEMRSLIKGSFLHDVGKIGIRDNILLNKARLSKQEFTIMKKHVQYGIDIIRQSRWLKDAEDVVAFHHEKYDGSGYPKGVQAEDIPLNARIFAIVDVFDALTSKRPYKEPFSYEQTMKILVEEKGVHFDPELLDIFTIIARKLYNNYSGHEGVEVQETLQKITDEYFHSGIETLHY